MEKTKIGILTSGGDAPGMNAVIRAVIRSGLEKGIDMVGIRYGYNGLINGDIIDMNARSVSDIMHRGGTVLYTARCAEFREKAGVLKAKETCIAKDIGGIVVIGGDGSFRGAADLSGEGIPCVGIPATIDNDIACTEYTIGYDTAMNTAIEMVDKIRDTIDSHDRCNLVEVMGRDAGHLALSVGVAAGATAIVVPEMEWSVKDLLARIQKAKAAGKHHFIFVFAEGIGHVNEYAKEIEAATGIETRGTVLGHIQRGGNPTVKDRVVGTQLGVYAVNLLEKHLGNRVIGLQNNKIVDFDIQEALSMKKPFDEELYKTAMRLAF